MMDGTTYFIEPLRDSDDGKHLLYKFDAKTFHVDNVVSEEQNTAATGSKIGTKDDEELLSGVNLKGK